jgi:hypothetical protein
VDHFCFMLQLNYLTTDWNSGEVNKLENWLSDEL